MDLEERLRADIELRLRRRMEEAIFDGVTTSSAAPSSPPLSAKDIVADLKRVMAELGPPTPQVRFSEYVPALIHATPKAEPISDDMRMMVEDIGPQHVAGGYRIGDTVFLNGIHAKKLCI